MQEAGIKIPAFFMWKKANIIILEILKKGWLKPSLFLLKSQEKVVDLGNKKKSEKKFLKNKLIGRFCRHIKKKEGELPNIIRLEKGFEFNKRYHSNIW